MNRISCLAFVCVLSAFQVQADDGKPNILLLVADDLGWKDVGYHDSFIETPNIDQIAKEGIELDRFYVQPTCSPTRSALMTGKSPITLGMYRPASKHALHGVPLDEKLLPQYLAALGYQRFMVGKWHLGMHKREQLPNARGFEHFYGSLTGGIGYWNKVHGGGYDLQRNGATVREEGYITHLLVDEVRTLLAQRDKTRPHLMYVAFQAPHLPNEAPPETIDKYAGKHDNPNRVVHAAMVDELDQAIGDILSMYKEAGMLANTLVFFMSDNGGLVPPGDDPATHSGIQKLGLVLADWFDRPVPGAGFRFIVSNVLDGGSDNSPLPGGKAFMKEGGVRVPAAIWWPGKLEGGKIDSPFTVSDVLPTLLEAIGAPEAIPADLNGLSQWAALNGGVSDAPDYVVSDLIEGFSIYRWPYKLIGAEEPRLYDVIADPLELHNLAAAQPKKVQELTKALDNWAYGEDPGLPSFYDIFFDPDTFGGKEDREPWPDQVID
ncbi:MAG: arylsulfatase B [Pseudomonadales bacterium]